MIVYSAVQCSVFVCGTYIWLIWLNSRLAIYCFYHKCGVSLTDVGLSSCAYMQKNSSPPYHDLPSILLQAMVYGWSCIFSILLEDTYGIAPKIQLLVACSKGFYAPLRYCATRTIRALTVVTRPYNTRNHVQYPLFVEILTQRGARGPLINWSLVITLIKGFYTVQVVVVSYELSIELSSVIRSWNH
jgi:hypothetical protein